ncbi:hypothetical protein [Erythrobacter mangrovi]|uniref:Uncharacterized protein n=1 Tax=Erythrobacter mangrovi TaxID=2739433 RepID=A0A7D4BX63_9SPHN|nr:hypothetical protein [Erythrobacter mangrovi]QKG72387.1 hypothetical protein HQR01_14000 [Erythrobacter mangrovi]
MSKWASEEIWRRAIEVQMRQLRDAERPNFILFQGEILNLNYTEAYRSKLRRRIERIRAGGEPGWLET